MSQNLKIAFIGLGNMGEPMVANLAKAGFALNVFDRSPERRKHIATQYGAAACDTWPELAAGAQVVITMLPTGKEVRAVLLETEGGLAKHLAPGTVVIDMSSADPLGSRALASELQESGLSLIDAPVSGGVPGALAGTLTIMAGTDQPSAIDTAMPVFEAMGQRIFRTGASGSGHAMKALNNFVAAATYAATAEALMIGQEFGLDESLMVDIINLSTGRSFNSEKVFAGHVVTATYQTGFALGLLTKDAGIASQLGQALNANAPVSRLVAERWTAACEARGPACDQSTAWLAWRAGH